jgi:hypothetical protein
MREDALCDTLDPAIEVLCAGRRGRADARSMMIDVSSVQLHGPASRVYDPPGSGVPLHAARERKGKRTPTPDS